MFRKIVLIGFSLFFLGSRASFASMVFLDYVPASQTFSPFSTGSVAIQVSGLGDKQPPSLGDYDLNLNYNPAVFTPTSFVFGDPVLGDQLALSGGSSYNASNFTTSGSANIQELSFNSATTLDTQQSGTFILGTLFFNTGAPGGTTQLTFTNNAFGDSQGADLPATLDTGSITVSGAASVPEPSSVFLALAGFTLLAIPVYRSRRRNIAQ